ncbi:MAG: transglycosylase SLT domain-containing protein [Spirochaetales bacterium]|nr:transglycosylase SLT domain-containing protein [Spirochaetales bacterium]
MSALLVELPSGSRIFLKKDKTVIGRHPDNDVVTSGKYVSRRHCAVVRRGASFYLEDLQSSNGTFLNGVKIGELARLRNNDTISLGQKSKAYQFRRDFTAVRRAGALMRRPLPLIAAAAAVVLIAGVLSYVFFFRRLGRIDVERGLRTLQLVHGRNAIPNDPAFRDAVEKWVELVRREDTFRDTLERRAAYKNEIEGVLRGSGLPADYSLIPWAESHYVPSARNWRSGAAGMWQLLPATARAYGLRVDRRVDERFDPTRSTEAAAGYLKDIVAMFGRDSFLLTVAAYNAGDQAVLYALKRIDDPVNDRNFWYLHRHDLLPPETKNYVLHVVALIIVANATER